MIYRKTLAGHQVVELVTETLRPELRRVLTLVNGRLSADQLTATTRDGEGVRILDELESRGFIERADTPARLAPPEPKFDSSLSPASYDARFRAARDAAQGAAQELLGPHFTNFVVAFSECRNSTELRMLIDAVSERLRRTLGPDAVSVFIECVRDAASRARA